MNIRYRTLVWGYIAVSLAVFLFSYTQVDLNLTLSRVSIWQEIQKAFQYVGYYQRPWAAGMHVSLVGMLFALYGLALGLVRKRIVGSGGVWRVIVLVTGILTFSYPAAFSYDFFNYLFTAKTVLVYHQNPYAVTPLAFSGIDPWTNFMRWTHLASAYTPLWIMLSLVPYILGFGYFLSVLFATKWMIAGFYLLSCWALWNTLSVTDPKRRAYGLAVFALNPLVLIETLVSGHNDIVLVAFAMLSVWAYVKKDMPLAWLFLSLSVAAKLMTLVLIPVYAMKRSRFWMFGVMLIAVAAVLLRREFLPWYWVWVLPFAALNAEKRGIVRFSAWVSAALVLSYVPYIYFGEYSAVEQVWKTGLIWSGVGAGIVSLAFPSHRD